MNFLVDENMPRSLVQMIRDLGHTASDVRDEGLQGRLDDEVLALATASDAIIITRDRGIANDRNWPAQFTAGVILVRLPQDLPPARTSQIVADIVSKRQPASLLGAVTFVEPQRALSHIIRRRP